MTNCTVCGTGLRPLFTGTYCPNEDRHKHLAASSWSDFITSDAIRGHTSQSFWFGKASRRWRRGQPKQPSRSLRVDHCPHEHCYTDGYLGQPSPTFCWDCGTGVPPHPGV